MKYLCTTFFAAVALAAAVAQAQIPEVPTASSDPGSNCYNLAATVAGTDVTFSWVRIDPIPACDTNIDSVNQLYLVYQLAPDGPVTNPRPTPFGLALGKAVTVSLPRAVYQVLGPMGLSAGPNYSFQPGTLPFFVGKIGQWQETLVVFVGSPGIWESAKFEHIPFATALYPAAFVGQRLTFGISLRGRTTGVFHQIDASGNRHEFRAEILSANPMQATVILPDEFVFTLPVTVTLIDDQTSLSADWIVFDPIAATLGGPHSRLLQRVR